MKTIVYTCPYVPAEWIAAHGLRPSRVMLDIKESSSFVGRREGVCPYVRLYIDEAITNSEASGIVVTTVCDQMRRAFDIIVREGALPTFLMNVPTTWQSATAHKLYRDELRRLGRFLICLGGQSPTNGELARVMLEYDGTRRSVLAARRYLTSRQYSEAIVEFNRDGKSGLVRNLTEEKPSTDGIPLAIIGGPLLRKNFKIFEMVEKFGGRIVLDATETGERGMCARFEHGGICNQPLIKLADAYFGGIPDVFRRPNTQLYSWLRQELAGRGVRGIIFRRYVWCDIWHAELARLKQQTELPVLDMDVGGDWHALMIRTEQQIRTFLEMLR